MDSNEPEKTQQVQHVPQKIAPILVSPVYDSRLLTSILGREIRIYLESGDDPSFQTWQKLDCIPTSEPRNYASVHALPLPQDDYSARLPELMQLAGSSVCMGYVKAVRGKCSELAAMFPNVWRGQQYVLYWGPILFSAPDFYCIRANTKSRLLKKMLEDAQLLVTMRSVPNS